MATPSTFMWDFHVEPRRRVGSVASMDLFEEILQNQHPHGLKPVGICLVTMVTLVGEILLLSKNNSLETKGSKKKHNFDMCLTSMPIMQPWFVPSRKIYAIDILCVRQETFFYSPCLLLESFLDSWQTQTTQYLARRLNHCSKLNE